MDVLKALRELYHEKSRLDRLIAICESKINEQDRRLTRSKRGRKSMSMEERKVVSERMRNYWAHRREAKSEQAAAVQGDPPPSTVDATAAPDESALAATSS